MGYLEKHSAAQLVLQIILLGQLDIGELQWWWLDLGLHKLLDLLWWCWDLVLDLLLLNLRWSGHFNFDDLLDLLGRSWDLILHLLVALIWGRWDNSLNELGDRDGGQVDLLLLDRWLLLLWQLDVVDGYLLLFLVVVLLELLQEGVELAGWILRGCKWQEKSCQDVSQLRQVAQAGKSEQGILVREEWENLEQCRMHSL